MPSLSSKSSMSLGELATCEDFLDGHREYAFGLLSSIGEIQERHSTDNCADTREGRACTLCEICSTDGLMGTTKNALASYEDAERHLKAVRTSLGKSAPSRGTSAQHSQSVTQGFSEVGAPSRETLFRSNLAKAVFLCIATVGDNLRSHHATWEARLQNGVATLSSSTQSSQCINTGPANLDKNGNSTTLLPIYSGPRFVNPEANSKLTVVSTGLVPETTSSSSVFLVFRRCLSSDCPCEANRTNTVANADFRSACGPQGTPKMPPSSLGSKETCKPKAVRSTTTNSRHRSRKTSDTSDALTQTSQGVQPQRPRNPDAQAIGSQNPQDVTLGEHELSSSASDAAWLTQETGSSSLSLECETLIEDPRISRLRALIVQSDSARRALMEWCQASMVNLQLDPREKHGAGPRYESSTRSTHVYPSAPTLSTVEPRKPLYMTGQIEEVDGEKTAQEIPFESEQEDLKGRWLAARQKRFKNQGANKTFGSRLDQTQVYTT